MRLFVACCLLYARVDHLSKSQQDYDLAWLTSISRSLTALPSSSREIEAKVVGRSPAHLLPYTKKHTVYQDNSTKTKAIFYLGCAGHRLQSEGIPKQKHVCIMKLKRSDPARHGSM